MNAGPELDALVAEKAMKWVNENGWWHTRDGDWTRWAVNGSARDLHPPFCPSTDIAAAKEVQAAIIAHVEPMGFTLIYQWGRWYAAVVLTMGTDVGDRYASAEGDSEVAAICALALEVFE